MGKLEELEEELKKLDADRRGAEVLASCLQPLASCFPSMLPLASCRLQLPP
jgi:hypothetical protein